tara:strand:- start:1269 stop:1634 length:366 start_codon:yes stop_codon:yes gene_type:complete
MGNIIKLIWISTFCTFIVSCNTKETTVSSNIIPEDRLVALLADFHLMDAAAKQNIVTNNHNTLVKHKQYLGVLKLHGFSKEQFDSTISFHVKDPANFKKIYEEVAIYLKLEKEKLEKEKKE